MEDLVIDAIRLNGGRFSDISVNTVALGRKVTTLSTEGSFNIYNQFMEKRKIKEETFSQFRDLAGLLGNYGQSLLRFSDELSPLLKELGDKTEDAVYIEKVLKSYKRIASEHEENLQKFMGMFTKIKYFQEELNPENFK